MVVLNSTVYICQPRYYSISVRVQITIREISQNQREIVLLGPRRASWQHGMVFPQLALNCLDKHESVRVASPFGGQLLVSSNDYAKVIFRLNDNLENIFVCARVVN